MAHIGKQAAIIAINHLIQPNLSWHAICSKTVAPTMVQRIIITDTNGG
jgi:hypothetical protein